MKVRVLGCSGAIAKDCRTTSFLIDHNILIDAGTGVGDLTLEEMRQIDHVFLTHSHLDHIAGLPLMLDAVSSLRGSPVVVHALRETIAALRLHIFNNVIWPDFSAIPTLNKPLLRYAAFTTGQQVPIGMRLIEVLPAVHTVPAVAFAVQGTKDWWVFSGDTGNNSALWAWINSHSISQLVVETAFSNQEQVLAAKSLHLSPAALAQELAHLRPDRLFPIHITHTKPSEAHIIMEEICNFVKAETLANGVTLDIHWLKMGHIFEM